MTLTVAPVPAEPAERRPDHPALVLGSERIIYAGLRNPTRRSATALRDHGCSPGRPDRPAAAEHTALPDGVLRVPARGAVAVPVHGQLRADEIVHVLGDSEAKALVCAAPMLTEGAKAAGVPLLTVMVEDGTDDDGPPRLDVLAERARPAPGTRLLLSLASPRGYSPDFLARAGAEDVDSLVDVKSRDRHA